MDCTPAASSNIGRCLYLAGGSFRSKGFPPAVFLNRFFMKRLFSAWLIVVLAGLAFASAAGVALACGLGPRYGLSLFESSLDLAPTIDRAPGNLHHHGRDCAIRFPLPDGENPSTFAIRRADASETIFAQQHTPRTTRTALSNTWNGAGPADQPTRRFSR